MFQRYRLHELSAWPVRANSNKQMMRVAKTLRKLTQRTLQIAITNRTLPSQQQDSRRFIPHPPDKSVRRTVSVVPETYRVRILASCRILEWKRRGTIPKRKTCPEPLGGPCSLVHQSTSTRVAAKLSKTRHVAEEQANSMPRRVLITFSLLELFPTVIV